MALKEKTPSKPKNLGGRPPGSTITREVEDLICKHIASGKSLVRTLRLIPNAPDYTTVCRHLRATMDLEDGFRQRYAQAREDQADYMADEILDIADDGSNDTYIDQKGYEQVNHDHIQRSRLRVDARKWVAAKLKPKKYGDSAVLKGDQEAPVNLGVIFYPPKKAAGEA